MKQLVENYSFNKTSKTVTFSDFSTIDLDRILLVTNVTRNIIIYNFADPATGGTVATNVLTLTYDTSAMSNTDKLQIFYEVASGDPYQDRALKVDGSGVTQPVSLSGVATAANQASELTKLDTIHTDLGTIDGHVDGLETLVTSTNAKLDTIHTDLGTIDSHVDGLETAVASTNTKLDTIHGDVDGLETLATSANTKLDTLHADLGSIDGHVDGLETLVTSTNTKLDTLHTDVDGVETSLSSIEAGIPAGLGQTTMSASMPVTVASDQSAVPVAQSTRANKANQQTTITSSTAETTIVTAVVGKSLDLYGLIITNTSSTGTKVTIKDATAGTTRVVFWVPANDTRGFMLSESGAIKQSAANNNWTATCGTSVNGIEITALTVQV